MALFWVTTPAINERGKSIGFLWFVPPGLDPASQEDMDWLAGKLVIEGIVSGQRLSTTLDKRGAKVISHRIPFALTARGIAAIGPFDNRVLDPDAAP